MTSNLSLATRRGGRIFSLANKNKRNLSCGRCLVSSVGVHQESTPRSSWRGNESLVSSPPTYSTGLSVSSACSYSTTAAICQAKLDLSLVKELRKRSGAPIVDCKKALQEIDVADTETEVVLQRALDWLRQHGAAKASSKLQGRAQADGLVALSSTDTAAVLVQVASETDFASKSETFGQFVDTVAKAVLESANESTPERLSEDSVLALPTTSSSSTVKDALDEAIVAIRENLSISKVILWTNVGSKAVPNSRFVGYVHNRTDHSPNAGSAAAIVQVAPMDKATVDESTLQEIGKKLAMHIVAARPLYKSAQDVPDSVLDKEREILRLEMEQQEGGKKKPDELVEKILNGKLQKYLGGICMDLQKHMIEEGNPVIGKYLKQHKVQLLRFESMEINP